MSGLKRRMQFHSVPITTDWNDSDDSLLWMVLHPLGQSPGQQSGKLSVRFSASHVDSEESHGIFNVDFKGTLCRGLTFYLLLRRSPNTVTQPDMLATFPRLLGLPVTCLLFEDLGSFSPCDSAS